jgi:hypothetical protein
MTLVFKKADGSGSWLAYPIWDDSQVGIGITPEAALGDLVFRFPKMFGLNYLSWINRPPSTLYPSGGVR